MSVWRGEERREEMVNPDGKVTTLHDDVVRLVERVDLCMKAFVVILPLWLSYEVWNYQRVSKINDEITLANAKGTAFLIEKVNKHHAGNGCHVENIRR